MQIPDDAYRSAASAELRQQLPVIAGDPGLY